MEPAKVIAVAKSQARDLRRVSMKLDCVDSLEYTQWEPGQEYKRTFVVRNIATKVQTVRWEPPVSPYFEVQFQEPHARLGPMMIAAINIVFRPAALENYESSVVFRTQRGQFTLELRGPLPKIDLGIPDFIDFNYGPVHDVTERTFMMKNTSDITVTYEWVVEAPFFIYPSRSSIQKGKNEMVYCRFQPEKAAAFSTTALCCTYLGVAAEMKMKGIGKYSFLAVATPLLEFGEIINRTTKELTIVVSNISIVPAKFYVKKVDNPLHISDCNFTIIPMTGVIKANKSFTFKVIFNPITAGTFSLEKFEIHTCQTCRASFSCSGTAARPVVKLSTFSLDFGSVEAGGYISRSVLLDNQSIIPVYFQFMTDEMRVFEFVQARAVCRPKRAMMITIHFRPHVIANYYRRIICVIQDQHALYCDLLGTCYKVALKAPTLMQYHVDQHRELLKTASVAIEVADDQNQAAFPSKKSILANIRPYFGSVPRASLKKGLDGSEWTDDAWHAMLAHPEETEAKTNKPDEPTSVQPPSGRGDGKTVTFAPGSNPHHTDKFAPGAAELANVYLNPEAGRVAQGPRHRTSAQQRELAQQLLKADVVDEFGPNNVGPDGVPYRRKSRLDSRYLVFSKTWQRGLEGFKRMYNHEIWDEYYIGRMEYWEPVTIDNQVLDFGKGPCMQLSEPQFLHVTNNLQTPVTLLWLVPRPPRVGEFTGIKPRPPPNKLERMINMQKDSPATKNTEIFHVVPDKAIIPVGGSYTFSVIFEPKAPNNHYCQQLHLFVWTPSPDRVLPPWSTTVCAAGHSFVMQSQEFPPEYSVTKTKVNFPPTLRGFSVYQTIVLRNHNGTVPLSFIFELDNLLPEFVVKPEQGLIPPGEFQLLTFRYDAGEPQKITDKVRCVLNHSAIDDLTFTLNASSHVPKLVLEKNGVMCFKPTAVGTRNTLYFVLRNASAIATEFEFQVPKKLAEVFIIKPIAGLLRTGESVNVSICFIPAKAHLYYCKIPVRAFAHVEKAFIQDNGMAFENVQTREINRIQLIANGEGMVESIRIDPVHINFKHVVVGRPHKVQITLKNVSAGSLRYALSANGRNKSKKDCVVSFDRPAGQLHGNTQLTVMVTFHAYKVHKFEFDVVCSTFLPLQEMPQYTNLLPETDPLRFVHEESFPNAPSAKSAYALLSAVAKYPCLNVAAVRGEGLSSPQLWRELQVRKLNAALALGRLNTQRSGEAVYEDLFCMGHPVDHERAFVFDFGAQLVSTNQSTVDLVIRSGNELPVSWRVRFWNDAEIDIENWVVPAAATNEERRYMLMRKFNLFHAEPRHGVIQPGEEQYLRLRYCHLMEGEHILPAILEVQYGRTTHLELRGRSMVEPPRVLIMDVDPHFLKPGTVGELNPPYQCVELCNRGPVDIDYELDTRALDKLRRDNFDFPVLSCQNPTGVVPALQSVLLNWVFQPLQARNYEVDLPVQVPEGEGRKLTLFARGVNPGESGELQDLERVANAPPDMWRSYDWPDVPVILTTELLDFHRVVELSDTHRLIAIQGLVDDCKVKFTWFNSAAVEQNVRGTFTVFPATGIIEPRQQVLCKVQFTAGIQPQIFEACLILATERIPKEFEELMSLPPDTPPMDPVEIHVDTWPKRLTMAFETRFFKHDCVIERFTRTAKLHMTEEARRRLERVEETRDFERLKQLETENLSFIPPPPTRTTVYLTVASHIVAKVYDTTAEDLLTAAERLSYRLPEKTQWEVHIELAFGIMMELLQDALHDEMRENSFHNLETDGIMAFEKFKFPRKSHSPQVEDDFDGLGEGELPPNEYRLNYEYPPDYEEEDPQEKPQDPDFIEYVDLLTKEQTLAANVNDKDDWRMKAIWIQHKRRQTPYTKPLKQHSRPSDRAPDMAFGVLEDWLFLIVKEIFDNDN
ncbi:cilia- and flagella-associated protein 65 [Marchantia polymorpha subsp. ruderalis]|uniref:Uncharacterized protein n=4 Tax=Marchantia polymorpha TaxID=3197 RepID=A0AAF6AQK5_MARPO|nr:hypothetical protein MARPO_0033s0087 [Marchantia polymorpha]BBM98725.1 hypothetical protein Mp_1g15740 [Marchantia polymorpha subsp. ruderalis]|eukprot:PTQ41681.1 hypothetical protein MARPO_0033s0087 [Marchantia polymorpha]